jgi:hypothetical protein
VVLSRQNDKEDKIVFWVEYTGDDGTHHKSHIPKIMFLCAIVVSHTRSDGTEFDGKIGIWPLVEEVPAQRASKNRPRGAIEIKGYNINAEAYYDVMTKDNGVLAKI